MIRVRETEALITEYELRQMYPNVSFPQVISEEDLDNFGCDVVFESPLPNLSRFQTAVLDGAELIDDKWFTKYTVVDLSQAEVERMTTTQWGAVRELRNKKLADTDWVVLKALETGTSVPQVWLDHRQDLRDITEQEDPFNIVWPELPSE